MRNETKNIIKCVVVLMCISLVCVLALALANKYLVVKATLDQKTATLINQMLPSGVSDEEAYSEGYFKIYSESELSEAGFNLKKFNKSHGNSKNKVLAVYSVQKGKYKGCFVVEASGNGYYGMVLLTAFDNNSAVYDIASKSNLEDDFSGQIFGEEKFELFKNEVIGKTEIPTDNEIIQMTGATTKYSVRGLYQSTSIATKAMQEISKISDKLLTLQGGDNE